MSLIVRQIMKRHPQTIAPEVPLPELEAAFLAQGVSGFPVVDKGELVGIVSRSDVVRQLSMEHETAEKTSDFYFDESGFHESPLCSFAEIADRVGERIEQLRVRDVMSRILVTVGPDQNIQLAAQKLADHRIHRLLVTESNQLLGLVSTLDLVGLIANGRYKAA